MKTKAPKPKLRGYLHQEAAFFAAGACALLIAKASSEKAILAVSLYSLSLITLFSVSAIYHRPHWDPKRRALLKRLDHSSIFFLIAGTATPLALLALPAVQGHQLMWAIWIGAGVGVAQSIFFPQAPKWVSALLAVGVGWLCLPFFGALVTALTHTQLVLLILGGVTYTLGAVVYALKKPNFSPSVFGYHELFHLLTILAAAMHFSVIYPLVS